MPDDLRVRNFSRRRQKIGSGLRVVVTNHGGREPRESRTTGVAIHGSPETWWSRQYGYDAALRALFQFGQY